MLATIATNVMRHRLPPAWRFEDGYTLVEMLVAAAMSLIVLTGVLSILESSQRTQARDTEWALTMREGRSGMSMMMREIRQAYSIKSATANSIDFYATLGGVKKEVFFECDVAQSGTSYHKCVRLAVNVGETLPAVSTGAPVVTDVLNPTSVFTYNNTTTPTESDVVTAKLEFPAAGTLKLAGAQTLTHHIVLQNDAYIRDLNLGEGG